MTTTMTTTEPEHQHLTDRILAYAAAGPFTAPDMATRCHVRPERIRTVLQRLITRDRIVAAGTEVAATGHERKLYRLP